MAGGNKLSSSTDRRDAAIAALSEKLDDVVQRLQQMESHSSSQDSHSEAPLHPSSPAATLGHSLRLDVPHFDGSDPRGWIFKIT